MPAYILAADCDPDWLGITTLPAVNYGHMHLESGKDESGSVDEHTDQE